jgi:hypothetical protein
MRPDAFEGRLRALDVFHALRLPPGRWVILRLDGRGFSRLTEARFEKPFDARFHDGIRQSRRGGRGDAGGGGVAAGLHSGRWCKRHNASGDECVRVLVNSVGAPPRGWTSCPGSGPSGAC